MVQTMFADGILQRDVDYADFSHITVVPEGDYIENAASDEALNL
jgi:hypothetical protein